MNHPDQAREIRAALTDPQKLCAALGLTQGARRQSRGVSICCPAHGERNPSCSVTRGPDGTVRVRCFSCDFSGDALTLVAVARGLNVRTQFREVLLEAARIAGLHGLVDELRGADTYQPRAPVASPKPEPQRGYPPASEVQRLVSLCGPVNDDAAACEHLVTRRIDPDAVTSLGIASVLPSPRRVVSLPWWARYRGNSWQSTGHRLVVPVYDESGVMRSVRAWRIEGDAPAKRLPPAGHKATGLVLANAAARALLSSECHAPCRILIVEGEPDWCTWITRTTEPVFGILSGSWHDGFAAKVPFGSEVVVRTHVDRAGERYAMDVLRTVRDRAQVYRLKADEDEAA